MGSFVKPLRFYEIMPFYPTLFHNNFTKFVDNFPFQIFSPFREKILAFPAGWLSFPSTLSIRQKNPPGVQVLQ
jgi:hypothetical protein